MDKKTREELNENDLKLLALCKNYPLSVTELANKMGIAIKNVSVRLKKLEEKGLIIITKGIGKKKKIRSKEGVKIKKYIVEVLKELNKNKGEMQIERFMKLHPLSDAIGNSEGFDKYNAVIQTLYTYPSLVDHVIKINEGGLKFLKENA